MEYRLQELEKWLLKCEYPPKLIKKGIHNPRLQGPAPKPRIRKIPYLLFRDMQAMWI